MDLLRIILFLGLVLHKLLWELLKRAEAAPKVQRRSADWLGGRLIKPGKALALLFLAAQTLFLDLLPIVEQPFALRIWGTLIYFVGLGIAVLGRVQLGNNWSDIEDCQVLPQQSLTTGGIYRYIRHPIYAGDILLLLGLQLALNSWLVAAVMIPLFVAVKQALEEEALLAQGFPAYADYCKRTKRFIPFVA